MRLKFVEVDRRNDGIKSYARPSTKSDLMPGDLPKQLGARLISVRKFSKSQKFGKFPSQNLLVFDETERLHASRLKTRARSYWARSDEKEIRYSYLIQGDLAARRVL